MALDGEVPTSIVAMLLSVKSGVAGMLGEEDVAASSVSSVDREPTDRTSPSNAIDTLMDNRVPGIVEGVPVLDAAFKGIDELIAALGGRVKVEDGYFVTN